MRCAPPPPPPACRCLKVYCRWLHGWVREVPIWALHKSLRTNKDLNVDYGAPVWGKATWKRCVQEKILSLCRVMHRTSHKSRAFVIKHVILQGDWIWDVAAARVVGWLLLSRACLFSPHKYTCRSLVYFPVSCFSLWRHCLLQCAIVHTSIAA